MAFRAGDRVGGKKHLAHLLVELNTGVEFNDGVVVSELSEKGPGFYLVEVEIPPYDECLSDDLQPFGLLLSYRVDSFSMTIESEADLPV